MLANATNPTGSGSQDTFQDLVAFCRTEATAASIPFKSNTRAVAPLGATGAQFAVDCYSTSTLTDLTNTQFLHWWVIARNSMSTP